MEGPSLRRSAAMAIGLLLASVFAGWAALPRSVAVLPELPEWVDSDDPFDGPGQDRYPAGFRQRQARIEAEMAGLDDAHPWAGAYYLGDGLGVNLRLALAPESGVVASWRGCLGLYGANLGEVRSLQEGAIALDFAIAQSDDASVRFPQNLQPVAWDGRRYLLDATQLDEFVADINAGHEPRDVRHGRYFLREGDEARRVEGLPDLPDVYRERISAEAEARLREVVPVAAADPPCRPPGMLGVLGTAMLVPFVGPGSGRCGPPARAQDAADARAR